MKFISVGCIFTLVFTFLTFSMLAENQETKSRLPGDSCLPIPIVYYGLKATQPGYRSFTLNANSFDAGSIDQCGSGKLSFSFSNNVNDTLRVFECDSRWFFFLNIWVTDDFGNQNFARTYIFIQFTSGGRDCEDPPENCIPVALTHYIFATDITYGPVGLPAWAFDMGSLDECDSEGLSYQAHFEFFSEYADTLMLPCILAHSPSNSIAASYGLKVTDQLGNQDEVISQLHITDNTAYCSQEIPEDNCGPTVLVFWGLAASVPPSGSFLLPPEPYIKYVDDACQSGNVDHALSRLQEPPVFNEGNLYFDCSELGIKYFNVHSRDAFGNQTYTKSFILLQDNYLPTAVCKGEFEVNLTPDASVIVEARALDDESTDICSSISFSFSIDTSDTKRIFTCDDVGTQMLELWVTDGDRNRSTCESLITINDQFLACDQYCDDSDITLSGNIENGIYRASETLMANGVIDMDKQVVMEAGQKIIFAAGFKVEKNGYLIGRIEDCITTTTDNELPNLESAAFEIQPRVYPNPFSDQIKVELDLIKSTELTVRLYDYAGKLIRILKKTEEIPGGRWSEEFSMAEFSSGIFFLEIKYNNKKVIKKLVKFPK